MIKRNLVKALALMTVSALLFAGCGKKSMQTSENVTTEAVTTEASETTEEETNKTAREETKADTGDKILDELIDAGYDKDTEYETDDKGTIFIVENGKKTEVETDKNNNIVPADAEKETEKAEKETEKETEKQSEKTDTAKPAQTKPADTKSDTKPAQTKPATVKSVTAKVNGTHYVGDTLGGGDFTVTVTMSDGSTLTNPAGWSASPLKLSSESNKITVSYNGVSSTITVKASKKAAAKPAETKPATPARTYSSDYEKHFIENGGKYRTNSDNTVTIISGGIDSTGKLMIPAKIDGKKVRDIDTTTVKYDTKWGPAEKSAYAFANGEVSKYTKVYSAKITGIYIEEGSTINLKENSFCGLNYCTYVYIPKSLKTIEGNWLSLETPKQKCKVIVNHPIGGDWNNGGITVNDVLDGSDREAVWLDLVYSD